MASASFVTESALVQLAAVNLPTKNDESKELLEFVKNASEARYVSPMSDISPNAASEQYVCDDSAKIGDSIF
jgi:hypothetical protein